MSDRAVGWGREAKESNIALCLCLLELHVGVESAEEGDVRTGRVEREGERYTRQGGVEPSARYVDVADIVLLERNTCKLFCKFEVDQ